MGATPLIVQLNVPPDGVEHPVCPGRGTAKGPPKMPVFRFRMLMAIGSIWADVRPNAGAINAADVVPSGLVGNTGSVGRVVDPLGSMPFLARTPCQLNSQKPPSLGIGPLTVPPKTFCNSRPFFLPS